MANVVYPQRNKRNKLRLIVTVLCLITFFNRTASQEPDLALTSVITGLDRPIQITNAGDGSNRLFVVHRDGEITVYDQLYNSLGTFLTVSGARIGTVVNDEDGVFSMAFHPKYGDLTSEFYGYFFVYYTNSAGDLEIARYKVSDGNPNVADPAKTVVLTIPHTGHTFHNGGTIRFGNDGFLYLATGDGGAYEHPSQSQNPTTLLGKMLRIEVNTSTSAPFYSIPAGNPYASTSDGIRDEIWAFGLRNPFRWSFDRQTHAMWIADVGEDLWEEIDHTPASSTGGENYGWQCYEGQINSNPTGCGPSSNYTFPAVAYTTAAGASVTGGTVYRGQTVPANAPLRGYYLAADYITGSFYKIRPNGAGWTTYIETGLGTRVVDIGEAENGELYAVSLRINSTPSSDGFISHITVSGVLPVTLVEFNATTSNGGVQLNWNTSSEQNLQQFEIEYGIDGNNFIRAGIVPAVNAANGSAYTFFHELSSSGRIFYRLKMMDFDGQFKYSGIVTVNVSRSSKNFVQPSIVRTGVMNVFLPNNSFNTLELINMNGAVLLKQNISGRSGKIDVPVPFVTTGTYIVQLRNKETTLRQFILVRR